MQAFAAPVRRCTKCQTLGHSMQQCCAKQTRCCKCGKGSHSHEKCDADVFSCVKRNGRRSAAYKGCTEMPIRQRAKEQDLHPLQRRHAEGPQRNETEGSAQLHSLPPSQWTFAGRETGQHRPRSLRTLELRCRRRG